MLPILAVPKGDDPISHCCVSLVPGLGGSTMSSLCGKDKDECSRGVTSGDDSDVMDQSQLREHTLNRLGNGPGSWQSARYDELGFDAFVAEQLAETLADIEFLDATPEAKLDRAALSQRQLEVGLLDFWFNHFNVDASSRTVREHLLPYQNDAIRPQVLGNFGDPGDNEPPAPVFSCSVDDGQLSWAEHERDKYWVYRSTDGENYSWIGRTLGDTSFTDPNAVAGATYQVITPESPVNSA